MKHRKATKLFLLLLLFFLLLVACEKAEHTNLGDKQNPLKAMEDNSEQYRLAEPGNLITFPRAHSPHKSYRHEWWYLTANLRSDSGQRFATQWTLFRIGINKRHWYFAHAALADTQQHFAEIREGREELGNVRLTQNPFSAAIDDWLWQSTAALLPARLNYGTAEHSADSDTNDQSWGVKLDLSASAPFFLQGEQGYSQKHLTEAIASHYYSNPFIDVQGDVYWQGEWHRVSGNGWFEREWGSQMLAEDQLGWDWFSLRLSKDLALMIYRIRSEQEDFLYGSLMHSDGYSETLAITDIQLKTSELNTGLYPQRFSLKVDSHGINLDIAVINKNQIMRFGIEYFEGMVSFTGSHTGEGFVEMTGYSEAE